MRASIKGCIVVTAVAAGALLAASCGETTGPGDQGQVQVLLTDAPADYLSSAEAWISRVYLVRGGDGEEVDGAPFIDLFNDPDNPRHFDLLTLRDGITAELTDPVGVAEGDYGQLRFIVDRARVVLKDGYQFRDGDTEADLFVPSGFQTGIKVQLAGPVSVVDGRLSIITVDFDVNDNFVLQGNPDTPAGIQGILFTPVLREMERAAEDAAG